jgi:hypothetical protein
MHCNLPIYYSWGYKVWSHEGNRPSKVVVRNEAIAKLLKRYPDANPEDYSLPSTWAKWVSCEDANGALMGTDATYPFQTNTEGEGI